MYNYRGNIHIHSQHSDGSADIPSIAEDAAAAGLHYIIICDHETLDGLPEEGMHQGVVVMVGAELNNEKNHYLALDIKELLPANNENPQELINKVSEAGGLGFIAHPFDRGSRYIEKGKAYPWQDWPVFGATGMEIWNFSSHWRGLHPNLLKTLYWFFLNRTGAMKGPPKRLLHLWDCYNMHNHKLVGIGSSDAHAYRYRKFFFSVVIFTYQYSFSTINTYVILPELLNEQFSMAKRQILGALQQGSCYTAFESLGRAHKFSFRAEAGAVTVLPGGEIILSKEVVLRVESPRKRSLIRLVKNGMVIMETYGNTLNYSPEVHGLYRVEVYYRPLFGRCRPWIYANPINILPCCSAK